MAHNNFEDELWQNRNGRLDESAEQAAIWRLLRDGPQRAVSLPGSAPRSRAGRPVRDVAHRLPAGLVSYASMTAEVTPYHLDQTFLSRRTLPSLPSAVIKGEREPIWPQRGQVKFVRKVSGARYHGRNRIWTVPTNSRFLRTRLGRVLTSDVARATWSAARGHRSAAATQHQATWFAHYTVRDGDLAHRRDELVHDAQGAIIAGNIGHSADALTEFWKAADKAERRTDSRIQDRLTIELPHWLAPSDMREILSRFGAEFTNRRLPWVGAAHKPDSHGDPRNFHLHIIVGTRPITRWEEQSIFDEAGHSVGRQMTPVFDKAKDRDAQGEQWITHLRKTYADTVNEVARNAAERDGTLIPRIFHPGSNAELGLNRAPSKHLGPRPSAIARRAIARGEPAPNVAVRRTSEGRRFIQAVRGFDADREALLVLIERLDRDEDTILRHSAVDDKRKKLLLEADAATVAIERCEASLSEFRRRLDAIGSDASGVRGGPARLDVSTIELIERAREAVGQAHGTERDLIRTLETTQREAQSAEAKRHEEVQLNKSVSDIPDALVITATPPAPTITQNILPSLPSPTTMQQLARSESKGMTETATSDPSVSIPTDAGVNAAQTHASPTARDRVTQSPGLASAPAISNERTTDTADSLSAPQTQSQAKPIRRKKQAAPKNEKRRPPSWMESRIATYPFWARNWDNNDAHSWLRRVRYANGFQYTEEVDPQWVLERLVERISGATWLPAPKRGRARVERTDGGLAVNIGDLKTIEITYSRSYGWDVDEALAKLRGRLPASFVDIHPRTPRDFWIDALQSLLSHVALAPGMRVIQSEARCEVADAWFVVCDGLGELDSRVKRNSTADRFIVRLDGGYLEFHGDNPLMESLLMTLVANRRADDVDMPLASIVKRKLDTGMYLDTPQAVGLSPDEFASLNTEATNCASMPFVQPWPDRPYLSSDIHRDRAEDIRRKEELAAERTAAIRRRAADPFDEPHVDAHPKSGLFRTVERLFSTLLGRDSPGHSSSTPFDWTASGSALPAPMSKARTGSAPASPAASHATESSPGDPPRPSAAPAPPTAKRPQRPDDGWDL
jgi:hypothetical protein